jgi:hypothetical protein
MEGGLGGCTILWDEMGWRRGVLLYYMYELACIGCWKWNLLHYSFHAKQRRSGFFMLQHTLHPLP